MLRGFCAAKEAEADHRECWRGENGPIAGRDLRTDGWETKLWRRAQIREKSSGGIH